ncbi:MAG: hypothetical protein K8R25_14095 [Methanosarcinales archaeon]|nr:hypothetical protein [Methanosarcinales archaeon]
MNSKTGIQIIAAFMVLTMVLSTIVMLFSGDNSDPADTIQPENLQDDYFNVAGNQIAHGFNSISDGLQMSTMDVYSSYFIDMEYINDTSFEPWDEQLSKNLTMVAPINSSILNNLYQSETKQVFLAEAFNRDFILLNTMNPKVVAFDYIGVPSNDSQYLILKRTDTGGINVMGDPTLYTSSLDNAEAVLTILENWNVQQTAYDTFIPVLNHSDDQSEFQVVVNLMFSPDAFADLYYLGMHKNDDESFTRTTIYYNPANETTSHINELAGTGLERGFTQYDVTTDEYIMKVVLTGEFLLVNAEDNK